MERHQIRLVVLTVALFAASCGKDGPGVPGLPNLPGVDALAEQCGIDVKCKAGGIAEGNASISGVASVDAFFKSVITFQAKADVVSAGIDAELQAIRADFGIAADADLEAELKLQISANVEGSLTVDVEPAKCQVDAQATLEAQAQCDASIDPGTAMVKCEGSCEVEASAKVECSAGATLNCTVNAPSVACEGTCKGSCEVMLTAAASCEGTCKGGCDGTCELENASGDCQGKCDGMCSGSCEAELAAGASCSGTCKGECTYTPPDANCEGGIHAECEAMAGAMVDCSGKCEGNFEPPSVKAECQASAKADASLNVECTPPRVAVHYALKAGVDAAVQARFEVALTNLVKLHLPALMASLKKADIVLDAGADLSASASGAVTGAVKALQDPKELNFRVLYGLKCATGQLGAVGDAIGGASGRLQASLTASAKLTSAIGV